MRVKPAIARDALEQNLVLDPRSRVEFREQPVDVALAILEETLLEVRRRQILKVIRKGEISFRRGESIPVLVGDPVVPVTARVEHLILALLVDQDLLVLFQV